MHIEAIDCESLEIGAFLDLPWSIYPGLHPWVPPLKASVRAELSPENLFFRHGQAQAFLCRDGDQALGRIVASIDHHLTDVRVGYFGYFEVVENPQAAALLLQAAEDWLNQEGCSRVQGPINLNIYTGYRLQTAGFETRPFLGEPRAPGYYQDFLLQAGYQPHATWNSWDIPAPVQAMMSAYMQQQVAKLSQPGDDFQPRFFNLAEFSQEMRRLHPLAMETFQDNFGFVLLDEDEFIQVFSALVPVIAKAPEFFGYIPGQEGEIAGFAYCYLDYAPAFEAMNGDAGRLALLDTCEPRSIVFHTFGIQEKYRHTAIAYQFFLDGLKFCQQRGISHVLGALAKEGRTAYDKLGNPTRSYAVFQKELD